MKIVDTCHVMVIFFFIFGAKLTNKEQES